MKPCPFCGGTEISLIDYKITRTFAELVDEVPLTRHVFYQCDKCKATGSHFIGDPTLLELKYMARASWEGENKYNE